MSLIALVSLRRTISAGVQLLNGRAMYTDFLSTADLLGTSFSISNTSSIIYLGIHFQFILFSPSAAQLQEYLMCIFFVFWLHNIELDSFSHRKVQSCERRCIVLSTLRSCALIAELGRLPHKLIVRLGMLFHCSTPSLLWISRAYSAFGWFSSNGWAYGICHPHNVFISTALILTTRLNHVSTLPWQHRIVIGQVRMPLICGPFCD